MNPNKETSKHIHIYKHDASICLESGVELSEVEIGFHTYGTLNKEKDNVIWVFHAFTGNSDVADWWSGMVSKNKLLDPDRYFIICANMLGSCYGTTGPMSINPKTKRAYGKNFPLVTIRDIVRVNQILKEHLGIREIKLGIGGSMGGQQGLEWAIMEPKLFSHLILAATNLRHSAWGIAFNNAQRLAIKADTSIHQKDGLIAARAIAMISYRNHRIFNQTQTDKDNNKTEAYKVECYQQYQGEKLAKRFDPNAYITLSKAMDSHNILRNRNEDVSHLLSKVKARTLIIGISSDLLFPTAEQMKIAQYIPQSVYKEIDSLYGHDGFLVEVDTISEISLEFIASTN